MAWYMKLLPALTRQSEFCSWDPCVKEGTNSCKLSSDLHLCGVSQGSTHTHTPVREIAKTALEHFFHLPASYKLPGFAFEAITSGSL